ncbi:MAG TPA: L-threonylcarbamoyladenylate synthase [Syntrophorhabdales bacterium]|nr:L-threonylcarbamoyladenylate synthase [Syntrophorhabdales bacterium]
MIVEWDPSRPKRKVTDAILGALQNGEIIAYPTDTFYGLGCDLFNVKAIRRLYEIRGLNEKRPLSVIFKDFKEVSIYAVMSDFAFRVLKVSLPGPYTFILQARRIIPRLMMSGKKEVGVRMPNHPVPMALARLLERPLINTSAKSQTLGLLTDPKEIDRYLKGSVALVIDGGLIPGEPSTVVSLVDDEVKVLREGKGPIRDLLAS